MCSVHWTLRDFVHSNFFLMRLLLLNLSQPCRSSVLTMIHGLGVSFHYFDLYIVLLVFIICIINRGLILSSKKLKKKYQRLNLQICVREYHFLIHKCCAHKHYFWDHADIIYTPLLSWDNYKTCSTHSLWLFLWIDSLNIHLFLSISSLPWLSSIRILHH